MSLLRRSLSWGFLLAGMGAGCVEPFETRLNFDTNLVTVDGTLTDLADPQLIRLRRSVSTTRNSVSQPLRGASVEVIVNGQTRLVLPETSPGDYALPGGFVAQPGATYQLRFSTQGTQYESTVEKMPASKPITRVYDTFDPEAIVGRVGTVTVFQPGHHLYLDTDDPAGTGDYYNWTWTSWERQETCATCTQGLYYTGRGCVRDPSLPDDNTYDYQCEQRCWEIFRNRLINVMSDTYSDGRPIRGREIAQIPLYTSSGALIEVRQQALTAGAFRYLKLLADQTQNTGSLADTPPASIFGNVSNVNDPNEKAVGYFTAASVSQIRYWLSRTNARGARPIGLLGGRSPNPEPTSVPPAPPRPPLAACFPSATRTPVKPEGWRD